MATSIKAVQKSRDDALLVEFAADAPNKGSFRHAVQKALGEKATIYSLEAMATLEIRDIDSVTDESEMGEALKRKFPTTGKVGVRVTPKHKGRQRWKAEKWKV